jgi:hypothetical protein
VISPRLAWSNPDLTNIEADVPAPAMANVHINLSTKSLHEIKSLKVENQRTISGGAMATEGEVRAAEIAAAEARTDTKIARLEGKMDLVLSKLDGLNSRFEDARTDAREARITAHSDNVATRANIWVAFVGLAAVIVALVLLFPTFLDFGAKIRDRITDEVKAQMPAPTIRPPQ